MSSLDGKSLEELKGLLVEAEKPVNHGSYVIGSSMLNTAQMQEDYVNRIKLKILLIEHGR